MASPTLEELERRVAALERQLTQGLPDAQPAARWKDWRQAVGRFTPGELSAEIDAAGQAIRAADRPQADA